MEQIMFKSQSTAELDVDSAAVVPHKGRIRKGTVQLRDIREDLKDRIADKRRAKANYLASAEEAERDIVHLEKMLAEESKRLEMQEMRVAFGSRAAAITMQAPTVPLDEFIRKELKFGADTKEELRQRAELAGYFKGGNESPGRVIHAKVMNLVKRGDAAKLPDGKIALIEKQTSPAGLVAKR
jgi:hypothetical protein